MAHILTLEGDRETFNFSPQLVDFANALAGDVPSGFEPVEVAGHFHVTGETGDELFGDAEITHVFCRGPGLNGELGRFSLRSPFKMRGLRVPKISAFKGLKLGKVKLPFKANFKGLQKSISSGVKGIQSSAKGFTKGINANVKGLTKGASKFVSKVGEGLSEVAEGALDAAGGLASSLTSQDGAMSPGEEEAPPDGSDPSMMEDPMSEAGMETEDAMMMDQQMAPDVQDAAQYGEAWFDAADEMAGELGKKSSNPMLAMNLMAIASGNPQLAQMAALANINQAQRNQVTRAKKRAQTQNLIKVGAAAGAAVFTGGTSLGALGAMPGLSGILGSQGMGVLSQALGPNGGAFDVITKTLGVNGLQDFAGLMGPGGVSQILSKLGSGGLGDILTKLGPNAAKLATRDGAKELVANLGKVNSPADLVRLLQNRLTNIPAPPPETATVDNAGNVTFARRDVTASASTSISTGTILAFGALGLGAIALMGRRSAA